MQNDFLNNYKDLRQKAENAKAYDLTKCTVIQVGCATCEDAAGAKLVKKEFQNLIKNSNRKDIYLHTVGCTGRCSVEPIVSILCPGKKNVIYGKVDAAGAQDIFAAHVLTGKIVEKYLLDDLNILPTQEKNPAQEILAKFDITKTFFKFYGDAEFYRNQTRLSLRNCGIVDPTDIDEYIRHEGFYGLSCALATNNPDAVVNEVVTSKLRGRGGGGFPTGKKWQFARMNKETTRYMICNADEGDPGAFMDRSMLESDPFNVVEGMIIAGYAIGAQKGFFYIRAEYPLAILRIENAIEICRQRGLLGKNILNSGFDYDLEIRLGAGAFVCGEETALIHSIEGERGQPRVRPPFPAVKGLWGKPTIINNVETLANIPVVLSIGGSEFAKIGSAQSGGTKVFALAGKINHTGLVEVPIGTSLKEIVYNIGGGIRNNKKLKAVQTGGPAGGFIPAKLSDTTVDYENLLKLGSILGSGGMIVLDEDDCIIDVAKFYLAFTQDESCGKCIPCREGTRRMLDILEKVTSGQAHIDDLKTLERLANLVQKSSLCGLGRAAPNPILSTLREYRDEYEAHVLRKVCPTGKCQNLIKYLINPEKCVGCTACAYKCPVQCISGERKKVHVIDQEKCIKCGMCYDACRFDAIDRV